MKSSWNLDLMVFLGQKNFLRQKVSAKLERIRASAILGLRRSGTVMGSFP